LPIRAADETNFDIFTACFIIISILSEPLCPKDYFAGRLESKAEV
jgi:hypothetical protein